MYLEGQGRRKFQIEARFCEHLPYPPMHSCPTIPLREEVMNSPTLDICIKEENCSV